jgi:two-component system response regulator RegX3
MHKLMIDGKPDELRAKEYKLLMYLIENAGRVVTKEELLKNVWGDEYICDGTIAVHIRHIREKIEPDLKNPTIIKTVWGVGYVVEREALGYGDGA